MNALNKSAQWDRYSNGVWSELQTKAYETRQRFAAGGHNDNELHRLADELREVCGGVRTATRLIPLVIAERQKSVQWGLERVLVAARRLESLPEVETAAREAIGEQVKALVLLVEGSDLDEAERQVKELEIRLEQEERSALNRGFAALLGTLDEQFVSVQ